jgi:pimeloyl-ACP methyl ester carboxylesterase
MKVSTPGPDARLLPLHVETTGSGDPVVLLHGFGASGFTWRHWAPELSRRHEVLLVDLKGFGSAAKPPDGRYSPTDLADDVHRLVHQRDLRRLTLVGHSLGGGIALLVALRLLEEGEGRLARLVSVSGVAYRQAIPHYIGMVRTRPLARSFLRVVPAGWLMRRVLCSVVHDPALVTAEQVEGYARPLRTSGARRALAETARQIVPDGLDGLVSRYPGLDVPALLIWGRHDPVVPLALGRRLAEDLPRARMVVLEGCGHLPAEEKPSESLAALTDFLAST